MGGPGSAGMCAGRGGDTQGEMRGNWTRVGVARTLVHLLRCTRAENSARRNILGAKSGLQPGSWPGAGAKRGEPAGEADQQSAEPAIGSERTAFFPSFGEEERYRSFRADGYRLSRRLAGRRPAGRRRRALQERGTMQVSTNGGDSKLHSRYLPWEGDAEQQGLLAEIPRDMAVQQSARGPPVRGNPSASPLWGGGRRESADARGVPSAKAEHAASRGAAMRRRVKAPARIRRSRARAGGSGRPAREPAIAEGWPRAGA